MLVPTPERLDSYVTVFPLVRELEVFRCQNRFTTRLAIKPENICFFANEQASHFACSFCLLSAKWRDQIVPECASKFPRLPAANWPLKRAGGDPRHGGGHSEAEATGIANRRFGL